MARKEVVLVPTELLIEHRHRAPPPSPPTAIAEEEERRTAARIHARRVHRLRIHAVAWTLGSILLTTLWVLSQRQATGAFERFGHEGDPGEWNPTLWALAIGVWGLIVGIMALRVRFERPPTEADVARVAAGLDAAVPAARRSAFRRLERARRLRFRVAAWVLGMLVVTPLWALIEWQDNGAFERWSDNSRPGDWDPWFLYVGGIWAFVIAILALVELFLARPARAAKVERVARRLARRR